jgi:hypothetical protein
MVDKHKYLYKYRYFDKKGYHLDILLKHQLYFASPPELNDPFDCKIPIRYDLLDLDELIRNRVHHIKRNNPKLDQYEVEKKAQNEAKEMAKTMTDKYPLALERQQQFADANFGICSFSKKENHNALWSLYSKDHKGFLIVFDKEVLENFFYEQSNQYTEEPMIIGEEIEYLQDMPIVKPIQNSKSEYQNSKKLLLTKSKDFEFEDEYRFISFKLGKKLVDIPKKAIVKVIAGIRTDMNNSIKLNRICLLNGISFYQAKRDLHSFKTDY